VIAAAKRSAPTFLKSSMTTGIEAAATPSATKDSGTELAGSCAIAFDAEERELLGSCGVSCTLIALLDFFLYWWHEGI
jgi:hypothetical protein